MSAGSNKPPRHGDDWGEKENRKLLKLLKDGIGYKAISDQSGRGLDALYQQRYILKKYGLPKKTRAKKKSAAARKSSTARKRSASRRKRR